MSQPTKQLFGTDGIRGVAGEFPLTYESTYAIGRALGHDLKRNNTQARVVITGRGVSGAIAQDGSRGGDLGVAQSLDR